MTFLWPPPNRLIGRSRQAAHRELGEHHGAMHPAYEEVTLERKPESWDEPDVPFRPYVDSPGEPDGAASGLCAARSRSQPQ